MTCHEKGENVGLELPKSLFPVNTKSVATVNIHGSQSGYFVVPGAIVQTSDITLSSTLNWS
jgi:hypothetical protein